MDLPSGEYSIRDAISGLDEFANMIGYCKLADYIDTAIECMNYILDKHVEADSE